MEISKLDNDYEMALNMSIADTYEGSGTFDQIVDVLSPREESESNLVSAESAVIAEKPAAFQNTPPVLFGGQQYKGKPYAKANSSSAPSREIDQDKRLAALCRPAEASETEERVESVERRVESVERSEKEKEGDKEKERDARALKCLQALKKLPSEQLHAVAKTLHTYISNLARNPMEEKYHRINTENKNFIATVAPHEDALELLKVCGFKGEDGSLVMDYAFMKSKGSFLWGIVAKIEVLMNK